MNAGKSKKTEPLPYASAGELPLRPLRWDLNNVLVWLFCIYVALVPIGHIVFYWGSTLAAGNELTADRAWFMAVNALTLTGFQSVMSLNTYPQRVQAAALVLMLAGAIFPMIVGGLCAARILRQPYSDRRIVLGALAACGILVLLGAMPLLESDGSSIANDRSPFQALFLSASAFGNGGLYLGPAPSILSLRTHLVLLPLAVLGGLGLPVLMEMFDAIMRRGKLSPHSRAVLRMTAGLYLAAFVLFLLARWLYAKPMAEGTVMKETTEMLAGCSAAAVNCRTFGLPYQFALDMPRLMIWLTIPFMVIGGSPGGTAGGLKTTTIAELFRGVRRCLCGEAPGRAFGMAMAWLGTYAAIAGVFFLILLWTDPTVSSERLLFETISGASNVGLSYDQVMMVKPGLIFLSLAMLFGRVAPLLILWHMAQTTENAQLVVAG